MKKIFYFLAALTLASAVSCVKEEAPVAPSTDSMTVTLGFDGGTKATLSDKWGISWNEGLELKWDGGSHTIVAEDIVDNTVTFVAQGLEVGETITSYSPVYESYTQTNPGSTNWTKLFLTGVAREEGKITTMQIAGSILRFIPYTEDYPTESVKSVTFESGETSYTVTISNPVSLGAYSYINDKGNEVNVQAANSKENALGRGIYLPLAPATYDSFKVTVRTVSGAKYTFASGAGKKLTLEENSVVNMSLPLDGHKEAQYTVTFNTDGGTAVPAQTVNNGDLVVKPEGVTKDFSGSLAEGLYLGVQDPDNVSYTLEGWYKDATKTQKYDFSTPVTGSLTLYAKWVSPEAIDLSGFSKDNNLLKAYAYINSLSLSEMTDYTFVLASNIEMWDGEFNLNKDNVRLTLVGAGQERILKRGGDGNFINCNKGVLILGKNITITGYPSAFKTFPALNINGTAQVIMQTGSKITGITECTFRGIVFLNSGNNTFTLDGGTITSNNVSNVTVDKYGNPTSAATVFVLYGKFIMKNGSISDNTVVNGDANTAGGVLVNQSYNTLTKTGGVISGNTASIQLADDATPTAQVKQQLLWVNKNIGYDTDLTESDNI